MNRRIAANRSKAQPASAVAPRNRGSARAWREQHLASAASSLRRIAARPFATALTVTVLSLALALPLLFWLLLDNARQLGGSFDNAGAISVFLKPHADAEAIAARLRTRAEIASVELKTPEQGLEEFRSQSGFADALKVLRYNPLPAALIVNLRPDAGEPAAASLVDELGRDSAVDLVQYDAQWRRRLSAILALVARTADVLAAVLAFAALLVIGNTVRLDIQGRAEEIEIMQLLGASDGFVRRPFLYTGLWYGVFAGLLSVTLIGIVEAALAGPLAQLTASYGERFSVHGLAPSGMFAVLGASAALGWLGAWLTASRHIALGQPH
ncbi:MAG TPA: permease-like cell division protein FtsX [Rudaea sp.]|nr:permease-like cell division protein FtsX [Rudaea sp.]